MISDMNYWTKVLKRIGILLLTLLGIYLAFKLAVFYMPFLVAFVLALMIEPIIRGLMKKFKLKRRTSSIIVFSIAILIIAGLIVWGIITVISESSNLLDGLNGYFETISNNFKEITSAFDFEKLHLSQEMVETAQNIGDQILITVTTWVKNLLSNVLSAIATLPTVGICIVISFLALYFICTDKIYMLDVLEHHLPEIWVKKIGKHIKQIAKSLGGLLKAEAILVTVSFFICLIGLYIFKFMGMNIEFPLLAAIGIGFVDALPIFGSATVMIPWAIISACNGDLTLGVCLIILLIIIGIVRQFMEPRVVAGQIGIHPIFTLIAMYTGFKFVGVLGMFVGPIVLIILKSIFGNLIDKGVLKSIFDRQA